MFLASLFIAMMMRLRLSDGREVTGVIYRRPKFLGADGTVAGAPLMA